MVQWSAGVSNGPVIAARCPFGHGQDVEGVVSRGQQKTAPEFLQQQADIECDAEGVWHIRGFDAARALLRAEARQAGFGVEALEQSPGLIRKPMIFQEGKEHHRSRKQTARFFSPKAVHGYREIAEQTAKELEEELMGLGRADFSDLSLKMSTRVIARILGLTHSLLPGMERRVEALFTPLDSWSWNPVKIYKLLTANWRLLKFFVLDVWPAKRAHQKNPQENVMTHSVNQGHSMLDILTECLMYAAAGMVTTREFMSVVLWHCLERPALRQTMLHAEEKERYQLMRELLRLEPVVGNLLRRTDKEIVLQHEEETFVIPKGALVDLHVYEVNTHSSVVGESPFLLEPGRTMEKRCPRVDSAVLSFGDGHHRCPGEHIALQETDIFIRRLLAIDTLRIEKAPTITRSELVKGYELRDFIIRVD